MLPHALTEGGILFVQSANRNGNGIPLNRILLTEFCFRTFSLRKFSKVPFPFISVKMNFESSVKFPFPLAATCFCTL